MTSRALDRRAVLDQLLHRLLGDVLAHAVVDAAAGEDHLRVVAELLRLVREVVRIDADAVAADEPGPERQEVPLRARRLRARRACRCRSRSKISASSFISAMLRSRCVFSITLAASATLMLLARWTPAVTTAAVDARRRARASPACRPTTTFMILRERVLLVARVDALGRVADEEVLLPLEARVLLEHRDADLLGHARVDGRLEDDDRAALEVLADRLATRRAAGRSRAGARRRPASARRR